jgi:UDP-N-acetyl-2-amino-2-deoxyglucuronate dehydrogenase
VNVGVIGTGAIATLHARAYRNLGYSIRVCTDLNERAGRAFADEHGAAFVQDYRQVCAFPGIDFVDVCTLPNFRLEAVEACAETGRHVQVQKPIATALDTAQQMIDMARRGGIVLGVVSQHRFDEASQFLVRALAAGRLGRLLQADAYVKWYRSDEYYSRPIKGSWAVEGGGALINQAIHQVDLLRWFAGAPAEVSGMWQLGAVHTIESEDVLSAVVRYRSGATGVLQAATAFWPGDPERIELHGTRGTAVITGDRLTRWDVKDDSGEPAPLAGAGASGASDPLAISVTPFERQFRDFTEAFTSGRKPLVSGEDAYAALEFVDGIYRSCRTGAPVRFKGD